MHEIKTVTYSRVDDLEIQLDLYLPPDVPPGPKGAIIFFHGGGMVAGCRKSLNYEEWLISEFMKSTRAIHFFTDIHARLDSWQ